MSEATVQILGSVPEALLREFLQHVRTFDATHPGCHFQIQILSNSRDSADSMVSMLEGLEPPIPVTGVMTRAKKS